jgi:hypothetical protein
MKVAIMQPYFMPYIGYFQLVNAVDKFVFYDDVQYIKGGRINRNRILINGEAKYINVPQIGASSNKLINEVGVDQRKKDYTNFLKTIEINYKRALFFDETFQLLKNVIERSYDNISEIAIESVKMCAEYLDLNTQFYVSSVAYPQTKGLERAERLKTICKDLGTNTYINAIGGQQLYSKEEFEKVNIDLKFIKTKPIQYKQFENDFVPWLSIIDVLMFNSPEEIQSMLNKYDLV